MSTLSNRYLTTCTACGTSHIIVNPTGDQLQLFVQDHDHPGGVITVRLNRRLAEAA